jgi:basic membrane protein A and related proteins
MAGLGRSLLALVLALALGVFAASCGDDENEEGGGSGGGQASGQAEEPMKVGMALTGPRNDKGYNQGYFDGLKEAEKEYDLETAVQDNANTPELYLDSLRNLAADNDVVFGVGAEFAEPGLTLGPQFPDVTFVIVNGEMSEEAPNVYAYFVRQGVPAYPGGVIAAQLTKSKKIGFIGGTEIPPTFGSQAAFEAGAQSVDPQIEQVSAIVGSFTDANKAKEAARAQIAAGADVLYAFQDGAAVSAVADAIEESGKDVKFMTPIFPRCEEFPDMDYGTAYLSAPAQVVSMMGDVINDKLPKEPRFYGIEDPEIQRFELCPDFATPEFEKLVKEATDGINSGEIKLPPDV